MPPKYDRDKQSSNDPSSNRPAAACLPLCFEDASDDDEDDEDAAPLREHVPAYRDPFCLSNLLGLDVPSSDLDALEEEIQALDQKPSAAKSEPAAAFFGAPAPAPASQRKRAHEQPSFQEPSKKHTPIPQQCQDHANDPLAPRPSPTASKTFPFSIPQQYQDHANDSLAPRPSLTASKTFPFILQTMLGEVEEIGLANMVSWRPHGRAFMVQNVAGFVSHVMPLYFKKQTQMASFLRQLSLYGFKRITNPGLLDRGSYYHPYFLRGRLDLCAYITRTRIKGHSAAGGPSNNPWTEPDFYNLPPVGTCRETTTESLNKHNETPLVEAAGRVKTHGLQLNETLREIMPRPLPHSFDNATVAAAQNHPTVSLRTASVEQNRLVFQVLSSPVECRRMAPSNMLAGARGAASSMLPTSRNEFLSNMSKLPNAFSSTVLDMFGRDHYEDDDDSFSNSIESLFEEDPKKRKLDKEDTELTAFLSGLNWSP